MKAFIPLCSALLASFLLLWPSISIADTDGGNYLKESLALWQAIHPEKDKVHLFSPLHFRFVTGAKAPLARYKPKEETHSVPGIDIGENLRQYRREYVVLSSNIDMSGKPDFNQYMVVLTTLSLANESTHYLQDENGSLHDFYELYHQGKADEACALYGLQQYVSDVVMLETAVRIEKYFLGQGFVKGINALRIALEKNEIRDEYEDFREGLRGRNTSSLNQVLSSIRKKRSHANMAGLSFCRADGDALLDETIINRATEPGKNALSGY